MPVITPLATALVTLLMSVTLVSAADLTIVTSTTDLASLTKAILGNKGTVTSIASGSQDPHTLEPRPSMITKVRNADLVISIGMSLDDWIYSLIDVAKNPKLTRRSTRFLDTSEGITKLEIPTHKIDGASGDVHAQGNPHYWLDPRNGQLMLTAIYTRLCIISPENKAYFQANYTDYRAKLAAIIAKTHTQLAPYAGTPIVTYHNSLPYFITSYQLTLTGCIEDKPGIPPSPRHIMALANTMTHTHTTVIVAEPWHPRNVIQKLASQTNATYIQFMPSVGAVPQIHDYLDLISYNANSLLQVLARK